VSAPPGDDDFRLMAAYGRLLFEAGRRGRREPGDRKLGFSLASLLPLISSHRCSTSA